MPVKTLEHSVTGLAKLVEPLRTGIYVEHAEQSVLVKSDGIARTTTRALSRAIGIMPPTDWRREITISRTTVAVLDENLSLYVVISGKGIGQHFDKLSQVLRDAPGQFTKYGNRRRVGQVRQIFAQLARDLKANPTEFTTE